MKLAEALNLRADIIKRLNQLQSRLLNNALVQDGDKPAENPEDLMCELNALVVQLEDLISRINLTNSKTVVDGKTLTELIAHKDALRVKIECMREFLNKASQKITRSTRTEIRILSTVDVAQLRKSLDTLQKEYREADVKLQGLNWNTDLI